MKKQLLYILVYGVLGSAAGFAYWLAKPEVYQAEMTVSYVYYEKKIYADMLAKVDLLAGSNDHKALSALLEIPLESAEHLKSVTTLNIERKPLGEDLSTAKLPFYIVVQVTDTSILGPLEGAILDYLNGTKYIQGRLNYMREKSNAEIDFLQKRLAVADSLSKILVTQSQGLSDEKSITRMELLEEALAIYSRIQEVKGMLEFNLNIEIMDGFIATSLPVGKNLRQFIIYGFLLGVGLRMLFLMFR